jgi:murein hydrolase activator
VSARRRSAFGVLLLLLLLPAFEAGAQQSSQLRQQQDQLERIRRERSQLERDMARAQGSVRDLTAEVRLLDRQADATARLVRALDEQLQAISSDVDSATIRLRSAEEELAHRRDRLHKRLRDIYKRGPMASTEAMLAAQSFGELVARYKYLHELAVHDRALVRRVEELRIQVARDRELLVSLQRSLQDSREDKAREEERLRALEKHRTTSLAETRRRAQQLERRIAQLRADEARVGRVINAAIEAARRRPAGSAAAPARAASSIRTSDVGRLDWPVDGTFLYDFGKEQRANNTAVRWNGIGIAAAAGTPVKAVAAGTVLEVSRFGTYGLTIIVEHGGGDYSVYGSLARADVQKGSTIAKGQQIGTVGVSDPEMGAHLHFEIRKGGPAVDPKTWLRQAR